MYTIIVCHDKLVSRIHVVELILLLKSCKTEARKGTRTTTKLQKPVEARCAVCWSDIKSRANTLTRVQSKAYTEPSSFSSLFNLPYSKDIHYFSQARHIAHSTTQCRKLYFYTTTNYRIFPCVLKSIGLLSFVNAREVLLNKY